MLFNKLYYMEFLCLIFLIDIGGREDGIIIYLDYFKFKFLI